MAATLRCIECGEPATIYMGHVHDGKENVIAGFCETHRPNKDYGYPDCKGCFGDWHKLMGKDEDFGKVFIVDA